MRGAIMLVTAAGVLGGCQVDRDEAAPVNRVSYTIDGVSVVVEEGLSFAVIDETKQLLGPNTHLFFEAGSPSPTPDRVLGDKIRINLPPTIVPGSNAVSFTPLPGRNNVWVQFRRSVKETWGAYEGDLTLTEVGGVGGRLRATFDELRLTNSCGESRVLTNGSIDVKVGSEDVFPTSEIDTGDASEWGQLDATEMIENNLVIQLDDAVFACPFVDYGPTTLSSEDSGTGQSEKALEIIAVCGCDHDVTGGGRPPSISLAANIPLSGHGLVVADGSQYSLFVSVDVKGTPFDFTDDETWYPLQAPQLFYHSVGSQLGAAIDVELAWPISLAYLDLTGSTPSLDRSRVKNLAAAHAYGAVNTN